MSRSTARHICFAWQRASLVLGQLRRKERGSRGLQSIHMRAVASLLALCASVMEPAKDAYCMALASQPLLTKSITCATLFTSSDVIAQIAEGRATRVAEPPLAEPAPHKDPVATTSSPLLRRTQSKREPPAGQEFVGKVVPTSNKGRTPSRTGLDKPRLARMAVYAGVIDTPLSSWFVSTVEGLAPGVSVKAVLFKAAAGQILWCPVIVAIYLTSHGLLRGNGPREIGIALKRASAVHELYLLVPSCACCILRSWFVSCACLQVDGRQRSSCRTAFGPPST